MMTMKNDLNPRDLLFQEYPKIYKAIDQSIGNIVGLHARRKLPLLQFPLQQQARRILSDAFLQ
jgi:hypothetical protein